MKIRAFLFLWSFLAPGMVLLAQSSPGAGRNLQLVDTVIAFRYLDHAIDLLGKRLPDDAMLQLDTSALMFEQILGRNSFPYAQVLLTKAKAYSAQRNHREAIAFLQEALSVLLLQEKGENQIQVATAYLDLGVQHYFLGDYPQAIGFTQKNIVVQQRLLGEKHPSVAIAYSNLGAFFYLSGDLQKAVEQHEKALAIRLATLPSNHSDLGDSYNNLGVAFLQKNQYGKAETYLKKALDLRLLIYGSSHPSLAGVYNNLGLIEEPKGDFNRAIQYYKKSLQILLKAFGENHREVPQAYNNIGANYFYLGDYQQSLNYKEKALEIGLRVLGEGHPELVKIYNNLGVTYEGLKKYEQAIVFKTKALEIRMLHFGPDNLYTARSFYNLGNSYLLTQQYEAAIQQYQKAAHIQEKVFGYQHVELAQTYRHWGEALRVSGRPAEAMAFFKRALEANRSNRSPVLSPVEMIRIQQQMGRTYLDEALFGRKTEKLDSARQQFLTAWEWIDKSHLELQEAGAKEALFREGFPTFGNLISLNQELQKRYPQQPYSHHSFQVAERTKAYSLFQGLQQSKALQFSGIPDSLLILDRQLQEDLSFWEKMRQSGLNQKISETDTAMLAIEARLLDLQRRYELLQQKLDAEFPAYKRLRFALDLATVPEIQQEILEEDQAMLEYFIGDSSLFIFVLRPDTIVIEEVRLDFSLQELIVELRQSIYQNRTTGAAVFAKTAFSLYERLIAPVQHLLPEKVIIIPDGVLGYLPFEILLTAKPEKVNRFNTHPYLLLRHQISYCYSATLLREMRMASREEETKASLLAMAPFFSGDTSLLANLFPEEVALRQGFEPLTNSGEEVFRIGKMWKGTILTGKEATEDAFLKMAGNFQILHLATHGRADDRVGDYSFLAFSEISDSLENELLFVRDLYQLKLKARLVVLSACETGLGRLNRGEGILSMARAFAYAGAGSILTTLWQVDDARSKDLMVGFYRQLKRGVSKDAALRQAKIDFLSRQNLAADAHPFYWAGFVLIGDTKALR